MIQGGVVVWVQRSLLDRRCHKPSDKSVARQKAPKPPPPPTTTAPTDNNTTNGQVSSPPRLKVMSSSNASHVSITKVRGWSGDTAVVGSTGGFEVGSERLDDQKDLNAYRSVMTL